jgi:glycosyltransferase involved in cell wall biosynthesis
MRLLIVSDMTHQKTKDGAFAGWGPTVQEIDSLSTRFEEIRLLMFLHPGDPSPHLLTYSASNIHCVPLPPSGGDSLFKKIDILIHSPLYLIKILSELTRADIVFVRCPCNIGLLAILLLAVWPHPKYRWVKYAGNWRPTFKDPLSYRLQRYWLNSGLHHGVVTVNGRWNRHPSFVYSFLNPCLTNEELHKALIGAAKKHLSLPLRLLFVGRVDREKGVGRLVQIAAVLKKKRIRFILDVVGDGPERSTFEKDAARLGLTASVQFHGWQSRHALPEFYRTAHFLLLPSTASEGWPKVISEAMAYGVVPLAGSISSIPQILKELGAGNALNPEDPAEFADTIIAYLKKPDHWLDQSRAAIQSAGKFTYDEYLSAVRHMFNSAWKIRLPEPESA